MLNKSYNLSTLIDFKKEYDTRCIKQLKNGKILFANKELYQIDIKTKKIIKIPASDNDIYDIIELDNGKIIGITDYCLIDIKLKDKYDEEKIDYNTLKLYEIPKEYILYKNTAFLHYKNHANLYLLQKNKLLIHFYRPNDDNYSKCGIDFLPQHYPNNLYVLDLNNLNIEYKFQYFNGEINIVILKNYICISYENYIYIFDIIDYTLLKEISINLYKYSEIYIYKFYDNKLLLTSNSCKFRDFAIFDLTDLSNIKFKQIKINFRIRDFDDDIKFRNKLFYKLKNGKILINIKNKIYIIDIPKHFELESYDEKKQYYNDDNDNDYFYYFYK